MLIGLGKRTLHYTVLEESKRNIIIIETGKRTKASCNSVLRERDKKGKIEDQNGN